MLHKIHKEQFFFGKQLFFTLLVSIDIVIVFRVEFIITLSFVISQFYQEHSLQLILECTLRSYIDVCNIFYEIKSPYSLSSLCSAIIMIYCYTFLYYLFGFPSTILVLSYSYSFSLNTHTHAHIYTVTFQN